MKIALLIALTPDRRGGVPLTDLLPLDEAKAKLKEFANSGFSPVAGHPHLELWGSGSALKSKRLAERPDAADAEAADAEAAAAEAAAAEAAAAEAEAAAAEAEAAAAEAAAAEAAAAEAAAAEAAAAKAAKNPKK
jgi:hypothetical protein